MKLVKFHLLTADYKSKNLLKMVWLSKDQLLSIQEIEQENSAKPLKEVDIQVLVKERVPEKLECQVKYCGWEDKEY